MTLHLPFIFIFNFLILVDLLTFVLTRVLGYDRAALGLVVVGAGCWRVEEVGVADLLAA